MCKKVVADAKVSSTICKESRVTGGNVDDERYLTVKDVWGCGEFRMTKI